MSNSEENSSRRELAMKLAAVDEFEVTIRLTGTCAAVMLWKLKCFSKSSECEQAVVKNLLDALADRMTLVIRSELDALTAPVLNEGEISMSHELLEGLAFEAWVKEKEAEKEGRGES